VNLQWASGPLLGSEQLNGGGVYGVRGYGESTAFGDEGLVTNNELHAPPMAIFKGRDRVDGFVFLDAASLNLRGDSENVDLRSAGVGINYQFGQHLSVRAAYGWQLKSLDRSTEHAHGHISAFVNW